MSENTRSAAEAFDALRAEVGVELRKLVAAMEKPAPDYNRTLGEITKRLGRIEADLARWEEHLPPVGLLGESYLPDQLMEITKEAKAAALELREATGYAIEQEAMRWGLAGMFGLGTVTGVLLFIGIANLMPSSAGTWIASAIFGGDPWSAGETLMRQADPTSFKRKVELYQACP